MDTTTAATQASVTVATIRHWCRYGAVAAAKVAGRWVIEAASLARRISLTAKKTVFSIETMTAIGGNRWIKNGHDRVYLNDWAALAGIETSHYNTGNISGATYQGETISNSQAYKLLASIDQVWFDAATGKLHCRYGYSESRVATPAEVWQAIVSGVRAAIAAL
ncbi:hypothetical protein [Nonomuraea basaltis]|uniref:hypothetical protein n=1 Tax=Nonomuraea basaltis TaxID=2495887 RepID=UPI00110C4F3A|nr:hypothetical protein [Nonomuraea basaltis]TMS00205.1 hypothetical protein EJK15_03780 [Nonomuraea basaltis]